MNKLKKFLKEKKVDKHFKRAGGPGQKLSDGGGSASIVSGSEQGGSVDRVAAADVAAQAAYKRLYKNETPTVSYSQKKIQMLAQRELDEEKKRNDPAYALAQLGLEPKKDIDEREFEHNSSISGVFYTCELLGDEVSLKKPELMREVEQYLLQQITSGEPEDQVVAAVLLLFSLNSSTVTETATGVLEKYLQNILSSDDVKFRRIRMSNKAFQERVLPAKGAVEFLKAVGFSEEMLSPSDCAPEEPFLIICDEKANDTAFLVSALDNLQNGQGLPIKVSRNISVFHLEKGCQLLPAPVSDDFFNMTAEEVKKEQTAKTEEVDRLLSLRTKEMRDRDSTLRNYKYKYTCVRIRLPDYLVLQGTFGSYEPFSAVRKFVFDHLSDEYQATEWNLKDPLNPSEEMTESSSLVELGLVPAAVLFLETSEGIGGSSLSDPYRQLAQPLSN